MSTLATVQRELRLEQAPLDGRTSINGSVYFVERDGYRVVFHWEMPIYRVAVPDVVHLREVAVNLRLSELATQEEIARAFGHTVITQSRWEHAFQKDGMEGLLPKRPSGRHPALDKSQDALLRKWFRQKLSNCEMAQRLSVVLQGAYLESRGRSRARLSSYSGRFSRPPQAGAPRNAALMD